jgi:hypothetical protein
LFRRSAMTGVIPLNETIDGTKGSSGWSQPELQAARPPNTWLHRWGVFVHERREGEKFDNYGCDQDCKYGFSMPSGSPWCNRCDHTRDFRDMVEHRKRIQ